MSIHNRGLGVTEMRKTLDFSLGSLALTTGETGVLACVPFPCLLDGAQISAFSVTSDVNLLFTVRRFIVGTGATTYNLGSTFAPRDFGTSGVFANGISLPVSGSTLLQLMPNDVLGYQVGGGATAGIFGFAGSFVVRPVQDVKRYFGFLGV